MTTFYIFRHGETFNSKNQVPYPADSSQIEILAESIPTVMKMGKHLATIAADKSYSSNYLRCRQTVEIVSAETGKSFVFDQRLIEFERESFADFQKRIENFLAEIKQSGDRTVFICTHGAVVACLKNLLLGKNFTLNDLKDYSPTSVLTIIEDQTVRYLDFSTT